MSTKTLATLSAVFGFIALLALLTSSGGVAQGAAPSGGTIPYSGQLSDELGQPVADGAFALRFELYDSAQGGKLLWSETQSGVVVTGGAFTTQLGRVAALPASARADGLWLAVSVRGPEEADFTLLNPRQSLDTAIAAAPASPAAASVCDHDHFGETWSGALDAWNAGLEVETTSESSTGIRGIANNVAGFDVYGVEGESTHGTGVSGSSLDGTGVIGYGGSGIGVYAHSNIGGTAIAIDGIIRVQDAAINSATPVFIHKVNTAAGGNLCASQAYSTVIDNFITNNQPNAILIVTPNYGSNTSGVGPAIGIPAVFYDAANTCGKGNNKWVIYNLNGAAQVNNSMFNVIVVLP